MSPPPGSLEKPLGVYSIGNPPPAKLSVGYVPWCEPHSLPRPPFPRLRVNGSFSRWRCRIWEALSGVWASLRRNWLKRLPGFLRPSVISQGALHIQGCTDCLHTHILKTHAHICTCKRTYWLSKWDGAHYQTDVKLEAPTGRDKDYI